MSELPTKKKLNNAMPSNTISARALRFGFVLLLLSLSGCATYQAYDGPERDKSEVATIEAVEGRWGLALVNFIMPFVMPKDDPAISNVSGRDVRTEKVQVLPGAHSLAVSYRRYPSVAICFAGYIGGGCIGETKARLYIDFFAEAGHEYKVRAERIDEHYRVWIKDDTTGEIIAEEYSSVS